MRTYYRPIPSLDPSPRVAALRLAGGWCTFGQIEVLRRGDASRIIPANEAPEHVLRHLTARRANWAGLGLDRPRLMGILNVTPDSFSDGGDHNAPDAAQARARTIMAEGADILDIGGESTRPGAAEVPVDTETARVLPVIDRLIGAGGSVPISIDTRKAAVARAAMAAGATIINDVSAFRHDPTMAKCAADTGAAVVLMHSRGTPATMQDTTGYDDVLLDVYDALETAVAQAETAGIPRARILVDPGIGFAKTDAQNAKLIGRISLFHALGCGVLLGASRKGFIGRFASIPDAANRGPASAALGLWALGQGVQVLRVHDIDMHRQGIALWQAISAAWTKE